MCKKITGKKYVKHLPEYKHRKQDDFRKKAIEDNFLKGSVIKYIDEKGD